MRFVRINVSNKKFFLSEKNILTDSPNLFTERFSPELDKSFSKVNYANLRMAIDRNPETFEYIHRYLQGYDIPSVNMSAMEKQFLLEDAKYYKLRSLVHKLSTDLNQDEYKPLVDYSDSEDEFEECSQDVTQNDIFRQGVDDYYFDNYYVIENYVQDLTKKFC